ncbi:PIN domain-containing protein [Rhizobium sp. LC145]|uniref:PIN domain-containing protein n=1 Tax=Rhizobium sp. LC145 TaxID=1120688 RepID=UPI00062A4EEB|nr:PIN domain-containing protein [Rhizobium sp. LC145]KKX29417.1 twitching motility protein PilT [Rhizobium sp. LC145]MDX3927954.1 PIN domain-containing protein [Shinella sp.]TKT69033.1 PIN domain-containing protein [Rhizobiaceae bacterium LC148]
MRVAFDTNVLAYAEGVNSSEKRDVALDLVRQLPQASVIIPAQVLGELFNVLVRKADRSRSEAREVLLSWKDTFSVMPTTPEAMMIAVDLVTDHRFSIWDAVILAVTSQAGCRLLLSEDMHEGFTWGGVTIVNPFAVPRHELLSILLSGHPN